MVPTQPPKQDSLPNTVPGAASREQPKIEHHLHYKDVTTAWKHYRQETDSKAFPNIDLYWKNLIYLCSEGTGVPIPETVAIINDFYGLDICY